LNLDHQAQRQLLGGEAALGIAGLAAELDRQEQWAGLCVFTDGEGQLEGDRSCIGAHGFFQDRINFLLRFGGLQLTEF